MSGAPPRLPADAQARLQQLMAPSPGRSPRRLLGLVGAPGAGKSTVAEAIAAALGEQARVVPMDGYHLAQAELERLGRAGRKGAPDTFDSDGYVALLRRLRTQTGDERVYAPEFRREIEEPVAGAIGVHGDTPLIVTEGNYLLLEQGPWQQVAGLLDEVWYVDVDETARRERLKARHMRYGRSEQQALDWMAQTDDPNARLIAAGRARAHWILSWD